jgi:hypothetical protein
LSKPIFEPTLVREVATNKWGAEQLFRRPARGAEWARVYFSAGLGDGAQSIANTGNDLVVWKHFQTSNETLFTTSPNNASGDTSLSVSAAGLIMTRLHSTWTAGTTFARGVFVTVPQDFAFGDPYTDPSNNTIIGTTTISGLVMGGAHVRLFALGSPPGFITANAYQRDSISRDLLSCELYVGWWPVTSPGVQIYG